MKKVLLLISALVLLIAATGCEPSNETEITFRNFASNSVLVNFRAELTTVAPGESITLRDIPRGKYAYETTYEIPANATSSSTVGPVSSEVNINAGTKILVVYSSSFIEGAYTLGATLTYSDDLGGDPVAP